MKNHFNLKKNKTHLIKELSNIKQIATRGFLTIFLMKDGSVKAGNNGFG